MEVRSTRRVVRGRRRRVRVAAVAQGPQVPELAEATCKAHPTRRRVIVGVVALRCVECRCVECRCDRRTSAASNKAVAISRVPAAAGRTRRVSRGKTRHSGLFTGVPHRFSPQGDDGPLKFSGYPYMYMPRSSIPVVSPSLAFTLRGLQPSGVLKPSAFPSLRPVILLDHNNQLFGTRSRGLHTRYTWLHTHPCGIRTQVRYRFGG